MGKEAPFGLQNYLFSWFSQEFDHEAGCEKNDFLKGLGPLI